MQAEAQVQLGVHQAAGVNKQDLHCGSLHPETCQFMTNGRPEKVVLLVAGDLRVD